MWLHSIPVFYNSNTSAVFTACSVPRLMCLLKRHSSTPMELFLSHSVKIHYADNIADEATYVTAATNSCVESGETDIITTPYYNARIQMYFIYNLDNDFVKSRVKFSWSSWYVGRKYSLSHAKIYSYVRSYINILYIYIHTRTPFILSAIYD